MSLLTFAAGLLLLVGGANILVRGASKLALSFGISPPVVGLTIVAAALEGERDIAVGNVVGSNTFNMLGCLGLSGLVVALIRRPAAAGAP